MQARRALLTVLVAATLGVAGCTGGSSGGAAPTGTSPTPSPSPSLTSSGTASAQTTPLAAKFDWGNFDLYRSYAEGLRGGSTFYELVWCQLEPAPGQVDWAPIDRIVKRADEVGVTLMLKIRVGSCWATSGAAQHVRGAKNKTESLMPSDLGTYADFVTRLVQRYAPQGVHEYAVENEINSAGFWGASPQDYLTLVTTASQAIRAADPSAVVVDPGISSTAYGYGMAQRLLQQGQVSDAIAAYNQYYVNRVGVRNNISTVSTRAELQAQLADSKARRNLDYLAMDEQLLRSGEVDVRQIHFYETSASIPALADYLAATTPSGMPIEAWEVGSFVRGKATVSDSVSTTEMVRKIALLLASGVTKVLWLPLLANETGTGNADEPRTGLLDSTGAERPAGALYLTMADDARGATWAGVSGNGLAGVTLTKAGHTVGYLWATGPSPVPLPSSAGTATSVVDDTPQTSISSTPVRADLTNGVEGITR